VQIYVVARWASCGSRDGFVTLAAPTNVGTVLGHSVEIAEHLKILLNIYDLIAMISIDFGSIIASMVCRSGCGFSSLVVT
jgi:hypothetical protein